MKNLIIVFFIQCLFFSNIVLADEARGTKEEAIHIVEIIVDYFNQHGAEDTFDTITHKRNPNFFYKDLYPFIYDLSGVNVSHGAKPHLVGQHLLSLKDPDGVELIKEMVELAKKNENGWVDYKWPDPSTNSITNKSSYIVPLGDQYLVGVGVYVN